MNMLDRKRAKKIIDEANTLMDAGPHDGRGVTNVEVVEALIWDIGKLLNNQEPTGIAELLARPSTKEGQA